MSWSQATSSGQDRTNRCGFLAHNEVLTTMLVYSACRPANKCQSQTGGSSGRKSMNKLQVEPRHRIAPYNTDCLETKVFSQVATEALKKAFQLPGEENETEAWHGLAFGRLTQTSRRDTGRVSLLPWMPTRSFLAQIVAECCDFGTQKFCSEI